MGNENLTSTYISLRSGLMAVVRGIVPPKEIEDIVQETYVRACQAEKVKEIKAPRAFLYKTARNLAFDYLKKAESRLTISENDDQVSTLKTEYSFEDETLERACSDEEFAQFCDAVRHLPIECRRTFVLKKVYGYSQKEIAKELKLSESSVEKHIAQGIKRCTFYMMRHQKNTLPQKTNKSPASNNSFKTSKGKLATVQLEKGKSS